MIAEHEAVVASRFDALHQRFNPALDSDDPRLCAVVKSLRPLAGKQILDLGCGKGRFGRALESHGASVVGLDLSAAMLKNATGLARVRASARRLPFRPASFDAVMAVEVFEHLPTRSVDLVFAEIRRVLKPGGTIVVVDKSVYSWNATRPWLPSVAIKWIDERRGLWMYPHRGPVRERWFGAGELRRRLGRWFLNVRVDHLLSPPERGKFPFEHLPGTRLFVSWTARTPGRAQ